MTTAKPPATVITNARRSAMSSTRRGGGRYDGGKSRTLPILIPGARRGDLASRLVASFSLGRVERAIIGSDALALARCEGRCSAVGNRRRRSTEAAGPQASGRHRFDPVGQRVTRWLRTPRHIGCGRTLAEVPAPPSQRSSPSVRRGGRRRVGASFNSDRASPSRLPGGPRRSTTRQCRRPILTSPGGAVA